MPAAASHRAAACACTLLPRSANALTSGASGSCSPPPTTGHGCTNDVDWTTRSAHSGTASTSRHPGALAASAALGVLGDRGARSRSAYVASGPPARFTAGELAMGVLSATTGAPCGTDKVLAPRRGIVYRPSASTLAPRARRRAAACVSPMRLASRSVSVHAGTRGSATCTRTPSVSVRDGLRPGEEVAVRLLGEWKERDAPRAPPWSAGLLSLLRQSGCASLQRVAPG